MTKLIQRQTIAKLSKKRWYYSLQALNDQIDRKRFLKLTTQNGGELASPP